MDYRPPGPSVYGISQARILEWVAISFLRESSPPRDRTQVSHIVGRLFTKSELPGKPVNNSYLQKGFQLFGKLIEKILCFKF